MKSIEELIDDIIELAEEGVLYTPDYFKDKYKMDEQLNQSKDNKAEILRRFEELEKEVENLKVCRNHWKTSYETMKQYKKKSWHKHEVLKEILDFYSRWKGVSQEWNSSLRTKRDRESWKIIKEVVLKINRWKTINDGSQTD